MARMSHGPRAGSRRKMTKSIKERGMPTVNRVMQKFELGELAAIDIEPSVHDGMPHHSFQGYTGRVGRQQGSCYMINIKVGGVKKQILAAPVHLKRIEGK